MSNLQLRAIAERGGNAAFVKFGEGNVDLDNIPRPDVLIGWQYGLEELVTEHDVLIFDDLPGDMMAGPRHILQTIIVASYHQGKRLVLTSNRAAPEIISQLSEPPKSWEGSRTNMEVAIRERIKQTWQLVEFRGESFRSGQPKWYAEVPRPEEMPTIDTAVLAAEALSGRRAENSS